LRTGFFGFVFFLFFFLLLLLFFIFGAVWFQVRVFPNVDAPLALFFDRGLKARLGL